MSILLIIILFSGTVTAINNVSLFFNDKEDKKITLLADLVTTTMKINGWTNIIIFGYFPDSMYLRLNMLPYTFTTSNTINDGDYYIEDVVPYHSNAIIMKCLDFANFEESLLRTISMPYWNPHANIYLYYHAKESKENFAKMMFVLWYYKASNAIIIQEDDEEEELLISYYTPYISDVYEIGEKFGCWTTRKLGMPINTFEESFLCERGCHNVTLKSKLRGTRLGTCIGIVTHALSYYDTAENIIKTVQLFEDHGKNFHGYTFRAYTTEVLPFMLIQEQPDGTYKLGSRDGTIWNTMAKLMNFTIDLTPSEKVMKKPFNFEITIQQIFSVAHRMGDFYLGPIYQFDVAVVELDNSFPYKDSGVCFMARRANFETILFKLNTFIANYDAMIKFSASFICIWLVFCLYGVAEKRNTNYMDLFGKSLLNSIRSVLLINLINPPKRRSFRLFLTIIMWSFFIINFSTQAAITSFFTAVKRGREVDTYDDIVQKGYKIEGMASPDVVLPDTEERFRKINSKLSPISDIFGCIRDLSKDSHRFCLQDCSVGRYLQSNQLDKDGKQYLHIAQDRVHNYYLNFIFPKHSVFTKYFNKYLMVFFEAGLIKKWEEYKFTDIKVDAPVKPLGIEDIAGIFQLHFVCLLVAVVVFFVELIVGNHQKIRPTQELKPKQKMKEAKLVKILK